MSDNRTIFADGVLDASVTHGVVRVTLAQAGADGKPFPAGQLIMPLVQLPGLANALVALLRQVESKVKEAQQANAAGGPATPSVEAPPAPATGAFRFS